jgi:sec-independent protein translocase protein TatC
MRIALLLGFITALPVILFEVGGFIVIGLNRRERRWIWGGVPLMFLFFLAGVVFSYGVMLPAALPFLMSTLGIRTDPRPEQYFSFVTNLMFWVGVSFELPLVMFLLAKVKIISAGMLVRQWRIAIVVIAIAAAVITPTGDPINMGLLMLPLVALYLLSVLFAKLAWPNEKSDVAQKEEPKDK